MSDYTNLVRRIQAVRDNKVKLATQLEALQKQEEAEMLQLNEMGVKNVDISIDKTAEEVQSLQLQIEAELTALEK